MEIKNLNTWLTFSWVTFRLDSCNGLLKLMSDILSRQR